MLNFIRLLDFSENTFVVNCCGFGQADYWSPSAQWRNSMMLAGQRGLVRQIENDILRLSLLSKAGLFGLSFTIHYNSQIFIMLFRMLCV